MGFATNAGKRRQLLAKPEEIWDTLFEGKRKARKIASQNMIEVREAMNLKTP